MKNNECCLNDRGIQVLTTYCRMMIFEFLQALFVPQQASVAIHTLKSFRVSNKTWDTTNPEATSICAMRCFGFCPEEPVSLKRCAKTGNGLWGACLADVSQRCYPVSNNRHIYSTIIQRPCTQWINFQLLRIPTHGWYHSITRTVSVSAITDNDPNPDSDPTVYPLTFISNFNPEL